MKTRSERFSVVLKIKNLEYDIFMRKLSEHMRQAAHEKSECELLELYFQDYQKRIKDLYLVQCNPNTINDYQNFIVEIKKAILGQKKKYKDAELKVSKLKVDWYNFKNQLECFEKRYRELLSLELQKRDTLMQSLIQEIGVCHRFFQNNC